MDNPEFERITQKVFNLLRFYQYLFLNKTTEVILLFFITFFLPLIPYIWVAFKIRNECDTIQRSFYGDGSMITLCAGIVCSYFVIFFDFKTEEQKKKNTILNILSIVLYVFMVLFFSECQLNFARSWGFINIVICSSSFLLILTFFFAAYLNFERNFESQEIRDFFDARARQEIEKKSNTLEKTEDGVTL